MWLNGEHCVLVQFELESLPQRVAIFLQEILLKGKRLVVMFYQQ